MRAVAFAFTFCTALTLGCSGSAGNPADLPPPAYDPAGAAAGALALYDKNKNGTLEAAEVEASPALKSAFTIIDTNKDKALSAEELRTRFEAYSKVTTGSIPAVAYVKFDDKPLEGATVTLEPEKFLASLMTAVGTTDANGRCNLWTIDGKKSTGVPVGLYTIRVTKDGVNIPAKFNSQSMLGREVMHEPRMAELVLELKLSTR